MFSTITAVRKTGNSSTGGGVKKVDKPQQAQILPQKQANKSVEESKKQIIKTNATIHKE